LTQLNFDSQSKIRREYIDLYLSAYSSIRLEDKASDSDASFRLAKMEDKLAVERLLLLKNIGESNASDHSIGVSGQCSSLSNSLVVGPAEIIVDWGWLKKIMRFASINKDVRPVGAAAALEYEDLLVRRTATSLEFNALSLTIPLHNVITDDRSEKQFGTATSDHFHVKTVNLHDSVRKDPGRIIVPTQESGKESNVHLLSNQDLLFVLDGFDIVIATQKRSTFRIMFIRTAALFFLPIC
jgi:hypothetical protein